MIDLWYIYQFSFTDDYFKAHFIVLKEIGTDWSKLVTFLDPEIDTAVIRDQNRNNVYDQGLEALKRWSQKHPADATVANLERGLKEIDRNDIIVTIKKILSAD